MDLIMNEFSRPMDVLILFACVTIVSAYMENIFINLDSIPKQNNYMWQKKYRPIYHFTAIEGSLSYPTGFTVYRGRYHLFYQYHHFNALNQMNWGHMTSENLIDWVHYPAAVLPKDFYDKQGCLAGSAVAYKDRLALFYTGQAVNKYKAELTQNVAISGDGMLFKKYVYNPVITGSSEFRDPKVWRYNGIWYMIVGATSKNGNGELVLYTSSDIFEWKYDGVIVRSFGDMGYVWESPDIIEINGHHVLILSVRGIKSDRYRFRNLYQTGYIVSFFNHTHKRFDDLELSTATFHQLDYGHDFYAAKTVTSVDGRKLLIAWLGMKRSDFIESSYDWSSMLTLIRELRLNQLGYIQMTPLREIAKQRVDILEKSWYSPGESFKAGTKHFELSVNSSSEFSNLGIMIDWEGGRFSIEYSAAHDYITIKRGGVDGVRRAFWAPTTHIYLRIFVDYSSIEIFCGDGEIVFSSRIYPAEMNIHVTGNTEVYMVLYKLGKTKKMKIREIYENIVKN